MRAIMMLLAVATDVWCVGGARARPSADGAGDAVVGLPGLGAALNKTLRLSAGFLQAAAGTTATANRSALFYALCENETLLAARGSGSPPPLVLWLQGGPGASSLFGLFAENGPFVLPSSISLADAGNAGGPAPELVPAEFGWTSFASMLYLDQPFGTGFSKPAASGPAAAGGYVQDEDELRVAAVQALEAFMLRHPRYQGQPLYIFGESFAGHMAPNIAARIQQRRAQVGGGYSLNLAGVAIGDGWVDPVEQNLAFPTFAYSTGLVGSQQHAQLAVWAAQCEGAILAGDYVRAFTQYCYYNLLDNITAWAGGVDPYDIRKYTSTPARKATSRAAAAAADTSLLGVYLGRPDVRAALNVPDGWPGWGANSAEVETALIRDLNAPTSLPLWAGLLDSGLPMLVYNGQFDLICNALGTDRYLQKLNFSGSASFHDAARRPWSLSDGTHAGWIKEGAGCVAACGASGAALLALLPAEALGASLPRFGRVWSAVLPWMRHLHSTLFHLWAKETPHHLALRVRVRDRVRDRRMTQVVVIGAGHMAPADQPRACHTMALTWITNAQARRAQQQATQQ